MNIRPIQNNRLAVHTPSLDFCPKSSFLGLLSCSQSPLNVIGQIANTRVASHPYRGVTVRFLVTSLTKTLLARLLSLAGETTLGRVPVVPNFFHFTIIQATVLLGTLKASEIVYTLALIYASPQRAPWSWFLSWHAVRIVGPYIHRCVCLFIQGFFAFIPFFLQNAISYRYGNRIYRLGLLV